MHIGDAVLAQLGELIRQRLPPGAFGARISGDRFAVLLPARVQDAETFAESLREGAERLGRHAGRGAPAGHHQRRRGAARVDRGASSRTSLATAETACKAAKDRGRNRVEVYEQADASIMRRFADISIAARRARGHRRAAGCTWTRS